MIKEDTLQDQLDTVKNNFESKADASIIKIYNERPHLLKKDFSA